MGTEHTYISVLEFNRDFIHIRSNFTSNENIELERPSFEFNFTGILLSKISKKMATIIKIFFL